jgi:hypothetical protein
MNTETDTPEESEYVNEMNNVRDETFEFLKNRMKDSPLHYTDFFDAVNDACVDIQHKFVKAVFDSCDEE